MMMECFFSLLECIINPTKTTANPITKMVDTSNRLSMINTTTPTANRIRTTMVATNGARLNRLSCHKAWNSILWFFFITMARKKGDTHTTINATFTSFAQNSGNIMRNKGVTNCKDKSITAMQSTI